MEALTEDDDAIDATVAAMQRALHHAGVSASELDYVNTHGTSTPMNDRVESAAIKAVFGEHAARLLVSSTKSMIGHTISAAGALELVTTVLALDDLIGAVTPEDVLDRVFEAFCVGK